MQQSVAEEQRHSIYQWITEQLPQGIICQNYLGQIVAMTPKAEALLGLSTAQLEESPEADVWAGVLYDNRQNPFNRENHPAMRALHLDQPCNAVGYAITNRDKWLAIDSAPYTDLTSHERYILSIITDISDDKTRVQQTQANLFKLSAIERINRICIGADTAEEMLEHSLKELLSIFDCDRAALIHVSETGAAAYPVTMEQTRPEWPGALSQKTEVPMTREASRLLQQILEHAGPLRVDNTHPVPALIEINEKFSIRSQMVMALRPKIDTPWLLGIHHCANDHLFSDDEVWLFNELGTRISIALSSLLSIRNLRDSEERYRSLVENAPDAIIVIDVEKMRLIDVNKNSCDLFGLRRNELFDIDVQRLSPIHQPSGQPSAQLFQRQIDQVLKGKQPVFEWTFINNDAERIPCEVRFLRLPSAKQPLIRGSIVNISERKRAEEHMRKLSRALQQTADAITITDRYGIIEYVNPAFEEITGYSSAEVIGQTPRLLSSKRHDDAFYARLWNTINAGEVFSDVITNKKKDGSLFHEEKTITPLKDDNGNITHFIATGRDITDRINTQERLHYLAHHDILTDLPNRASFHERLQHETKRAHRNHQHFAVFFIDLDRFKIINDTLGHDVGDRVLQVTAERLIKNLRASDTVARLGGDEFAILLPEITTIDEVAAIAEKLLRDLERPFFVTERELFISASIGISLYPDDSDDPRILVKHADMAMYRAKNMGRNTYEFFSEELSNRAEERLALETKLRRALERGELLLHYQPQISLESGRITGVEALLRWEHPEHGLTPPDQFIPILEETGLIIEVGEWVARRGCQQLRRWHNAGYPIRLAINVSSRQFNDERFEERIRTALSDSAIDPRYVELEITESLLMQNPGKTEEMLQSFSSMGIDLAIDDFGVGYSSLSYLRRFPLDTLKIDRSFVRDITTNADDAAIVSTIIAMAKTLKLAVIAEGVETQEQFDFLKERQCEAFQGYLFSKPVVADEVDRLLLQHNS